MAKTPKTLTASPTPTKEHFDCNLPGLLKEVLDNPTTGILRIPINITLGILAQLAQLAVEIDDPRLHIMMLRLGLYDVPASERVGKIKELKKEIEDHDKPKEEMHDGTH